MEAFLFGLDILFMFLLVLQVCRSERRTDQKPGLGLFAYKEHRDEH